MKVQFDLIYPSVNRQFPQPSDSEKHIPIVLNMGCELWKTNTAMRQGFCNLIFAGAGNHPGNDYDRQFGAEFDAGDPGINNVHRQWAKAGRMRSMSVGDIVRIDPDNFNEYWVCDSLGWTLLSETEATDWLNFPRNYGCCGFELTEWMENNSRHSVANKL